jgi:hypothetical protein
MKKSLLRTLVILFAVLIGAAFSHIAGKNDILHNPQAKSAAVKKNLDVSYIQRLIHK